MHHSHEIILVVRVLFQKLKELGLEFDGGAAIHIFQKESRYTEIWVATPDEITPNARVRLPYDHEDFKDNPIIQDIWNEWESGNHIRNRKYTKEEKDRYFNFVFKYNDDSVIPAAVKDWIRQTDGYTATFVCEKNSLLGANSWTGQEFTEAEFELLKRMARVFEQAYVRFLDLQKSEAQAREAQIEAALERVRSRAMAMHSSDELKDVVHELRVQMGLLGQRDLDTCVIHLHDESPDYIYAWAALRAPSKKGEIFDASVPVPKKGLRIIEEELNAYHSNKKDYVIVNEGEKISQWLDFIHGVSPEAFGIIEESERIEESNGHKAFWSFADFSGDSLLMVTLEQPEEASRALLRRFANVFGLAYRRFADLKNAEANVQEALSRASIERVRREIASMRSDKDLDRITPLIWNELTNLGISFLRCGVFIMDEPNHEVNAFLSTPDGKSIVAFDLDYQTSNLQEVADHWRQGKTFVTHWSTKEFGELADILVAQGSLKSRSQYLESIPIVGIFLHYVPFLQGMLYVGNTKRFSDEDLNLVRSLAESFSVAYARYEDFGKLEAAKKQIEIALDELRQTQAQLIQQEKLASLGQLTAGIAHEIKNPLNFVNNFSEVSIEMIEETLEEAEKGEAKDETLIRENLVDIQSNLVKIHEHGSRANGIVTSMLQHSRGGSGKKEPTDLNGLIKEFVNLSFHGMRAGKNPIHVEIAFDLDKEIREVELVKEDFSRVIINLCNNAIDAMRSTAEIRPPKLTIRSKMNLEEISIEVEDNGPGIPDAIKDKILQPFFTTKKGTEGTGLGLSITHDIIKAHGGEIMIETEENFGSRFIILLPIVYS